jgi:hypothetical protein
MTSNQYTRIHKTTGWTRTPMRDGSGNYTITPADESGDRIVAFMSAGSWQNLPNDDKARQGEDRVVLVSGAELPAWAVEWLEKANRKLCGNARQAFRDAVADADWHQDRRDADAY